MLHFLTRTAKTRECLLPTLSELMEFLGYECVDSNGDSFYSSYPRPGTERLAGRLDTENWGSYAPLLIQENSMGKIITFIALCCSLFTATAVFSQDAAAAAVERGAKYVALGSSFAAGPGVAARFLHQNSA